jgi:hypothetical protein
MNNESLKRWRLVLGGNDADGTNYSLSDTDLEKDIALSALYEFERKEEFGYYEDSNGNAVSKKDGKGRSKPSIARWLGDIRKYFPKSVVDIMQKDAMNFPDLKEKMILEPEILQQAKPNVHLV